MFTLGLIFFRHQWLMLLEEWLEMIATFQFFKKNKLYVELIVLFGLMVFYWFYQKPEITIVEWQSEKCTHMNYNFYFETFWQPSLMALREQEKLDGVVSSGKSEMEKMILLCSWTRAQLKRQPVPRGMYEPYANALALLKMVRDGQLKGPRCGEYAVVFMQACLSLGYQARLISIESVDGGGHRLPEVWSNQLEKWIIMDPYYDCYFEKKGIPLNALELHNNLVANQFDDVRIVWGESAHESEIQEIEFYLERYFHLTYMGVPELVWVPFNVLNHL